ncbi:MAG: hypothetical protein J0G32_00300 [Alphaproteobacteria bacterium]|nr:hypothetical protein [Alphaproteobacteria bacterium]OJV13580.1 MAG: hypothetical protein BGO27_03075 [Alphaproteobacteria bacterium 33-17]
MATNFLTFYVPDRDYHYKKLEEFIADPTYTHLSFGKGVFYSSGTIADWLSGYLKSFVSFCFISTIIILQCIFEPRNLNIRDLLYSRNYEDKNSMKWLDKIIFKYEYDHANVDFSNLKFSGKEVVAFLNDYYKSGVNEHYQRESVKNLFEHKYLDADILTTHDKIDVNTPYAAILDIDYGY